MNVNLTDQDLDFRDEVRTFLTEKYPADIRDKRNKGVTLSREEMVRWQKVLFEQGWFAVNWPTEYGGTGWSVIQQYIFANELAAANVPNIVPFGVKMVGELLIDLIGPTALFGHSAWTSAGNPASFALPVPSLPTLSGVEFTAQGAILDVTGASGLLVGLTNGLAFEFF